jgi:hypothetical protein
MKIVKFLLILILMGLSFVFGMKYGEIELKKNIVPIEGGVRVVGDKGVVIDALPEDIENVNIEIKEEVTFDEALIEEISSPENSGNQEGERVETEDFNIENFDEVGAASDVPEQVKTEAQPAEVVAPQSQTEAQTLPAPTPNTDTIM